MDSFASFVGTQEKNSLFLTIKELFQVETPISTQDLWIDKS